MKSPMLITKAIEFLKKCVGAIHRYVTNAMCTLLIMRHVSADCDFSILECLRPEEVTIIVIIFVTICS